MLQRRSGRHLAASADDEREMLDIIKEAFSGVAGGGGSLETNQKADETWKVCGQVDWGLGSSRALRSPRVEEWKEELGIAAFCQGGSPDERDDTCKALHALVKATKRLVRRFPKGPRFYNAFVVNWGNFSSWSRGAVGAVDWQAAAPRARVQDPSGIVGYSVCNIVRTVLTQSPNQQSTGTCSHVAILGVLAEKAPAKALEMAVRLLWTGRHTPDVPAPCDYVYERQPGLVPWRNEEGEWVPKAAAAHMKGLKSSCTGSEVDCAEGTGSPGNPAGLAYMWEAAAISEFSLAHGGECTGRKLNALNVPGLSAKDAKANEQDESGSQGSLLWSCNQFIDPKHRSCSYEANPASCVGLPEKLCRASVLANVAPEVWEKVTAWLNSVTADERSAYEALNVSKAAVERRDLRGLRTSGSYTPPYWDEVWKGAPRGLREKGEASLASGFGSLVAGLSSQLLPKVMYPSIDSLDLVPSFTPELLNKACSARAALLLVDSAPLSLMVTFEEMGINYTGQVPFYGLGANEPLGSTAEEKMASAAERAGFYSYATVMGKPHGQCDHAVYLSSCDEGANAYKVWSWGKVFHATREMLLGVPARGPGVPGFVNTGMVCGGVLADQITWATSDVEA